MISLYIGTPSMKFKASNPSIPLYRVYDKNSVQDFIESCSEVYGEIPIALEDISILSPSSQSFLLKFLEETTVTLSLLARFDSVLPTVISRCDRVVKFIPMTPPIYGRDPLVTTFEKYKTTTNSNEKWKYVSEENPSLSLYLYKYKGISEKKLLFFERG